MDVGNLKFWLGKDQAKNCEHLMKHLANAVQGKHRAPSALTPLNGIDCAFPEVKMDGLATEPTTKETEIAWEMQEMRNKEKKVKHKMEL